jgi:hypothetical protein
MHGTHVGVQPPPKAVGWNNGLGAMLLHIGLRQDAEEVLPMSHAPPQNAKNASEAHSDLTL